MYVRAFEDLMDLFRAVMVGASGTPYHDGLFFFDLQLPPSYPAAPPLVNYRAFGLRLNPNHYESGTVCLSLLDTFGGTELWSPVSSAVLQVLVSIQGLVLTAQPFCNETGYEFRGSFRRSRRSALTTYASNEFF
jgi:ubiquitin-conjugating enzyme E2 O